MDEYSLYFISIQTNAIRILFESLKEVMADVNFEFSPTGVKMISIEKKKNDRESLALVHLNLDAEKFDFFSCPETIQVGVNLVSIFKVLKSAKNSDIIIFYMLKNDITQLHIKIENKDKKITILNSLKTLDIDSQLIVIPDIEFDSVINIPSSDFQSYIRDLSILSNIVNIKTADNKLILTSKGDFASKVITVQESGNGIHLSKIGESDNNFNIKYILLFTKGTNLCNNIELYLKNKYPLVIVYNVANLGKIKFCLAPLEN